MIARWHEGGEEEEDAAAGVGEPAVAAPPPASRLRLGPNDDGERRIRTTVVGPSAHTSATAGPMVMALPP